MIFKSHHAFRTLLVIRLAIVGLVEPQRRAWMVGDDVGEAEFANAGFAALDRGDDAHHTDLRIDESLHRFAHPR
jgi:hypothetical protein